MFGVVVYDRWFVHVREVYICEWDRTLLATRQTLIATGVFSTKIGASLWVKSTIYSYLTTNGQLSYHGAIA